MKTNKIEPGKYYAVGKDIGRFSNMRKVFVVSIGKWSRHRQYYYLPTGNRTVVGIAGYYGYGGLWYPGTVFPQMVWGLWEEWEAEEKRRDSEAQEVWKLQTEQIENLKARLIESGLFGAYLNGFAFLTTKGVVEVSLSKFETLLSLALR